MIFKERYKGLLKSESEVRARLNNNCCIENNIIRDIRVLVTGHFGNCVSLEIACENIFPVSSYNNTKNIGYVLSALIDIFDKEDDNGVNITKLNGTPIRVVYNDKSSCGSKSVAIGHYMKDRFIFIDDLMKFDRGIKWIVNGI